MIKLVIKYFKVIFLRPVFGQKSSMVHKRCFFRNLHEFWSSRCKSLDIVFIVFAQKVLFKRSKSNDLAIYTPIGLSKLVNFERKWPNLAKSYLKLK